MKWQSANLQSRLRIISAAILLAGLLISSAIYLTAPEESDDMTIYGLEHSKAYRHDLELYGGKANVLISEFMEWFQGLWHGKSLAYTIAVIAIVTSVMLCYVARLVAADTGPEDS
jgi:hypothetical protein